ncbi:fructosamine kinase family protein [Amycolatopsis minnesotensis]|uniref:Fructosamine kinase family protein n=1 Tax=Amycolatopsis minnesotensis TaxID=337894 RepID=A0ABN2RIY5_9PSEU
MLDLRRRGSAVYLAALDGGRVVFVKGGAGAGAVAAESAGLHWLAEHGDLPVPEVLGADEDWLVLRYLPGGRPTAEAAARFGRGLAATHLRGASGFGCPPPGGPADAWIGLAPMRNTTHDTWAGFYAAERIQPYVRMCVDDGVFGRDDAAVFDKLCARLPDLGFAEEAPARLHGDLWSGNVYWADDGQAWLIDPAAHGGHREADLAMLHLFGTPFLQHIVGGYREAAQEAGAPLADGWRDRVKLHQLFPLLVHAALFGGGYVKEALTAAHTAG